MAYREVSDLSSDVTVALGGTNKQTGKKNPTEVEGYYLGFREVANKKGKSKIHFFQTAKGNVGVWGKTDSDRKLSAVTPGAMTKIWFDKMVDTPNGTMYKYRVAVDDTNIITVLDTPQASTSTDSEDDYTPEELPNEDEEQTKALLQAERKAKVEALLRGAKNKN